MTSLTPREDDFSLDIQRTIESNLEEAYLKVAQAAPALVDRWIYLALSEKVKPYAQETAIKNSLAFVQEGYVARRNKEELEKIQDTLDLLDGKAPAIINVESDG